MNRKLIVCIVGCMLSWTAVAGDTIFYTLQACRDLALSNSASAKAEKEAQLVAKYNRQAAFAAMFPRLSANGGYAWNSRNAHLLADQTEFSFGTASVTDGTGSFQWSDQSSIGQLAKDVEGTLLERPIQNLETNLGQKIGGLYERLYNDLTINLTHVVVAQVGITQPIYAGGRLINLYKIAKSTEHMAEIQAGAKHDDLIYKVDEAYWRVVSVAHKKRLADQYLRLLRKLENDVTEAVNEGMATQSDLLKVKTKCGEAEVKQLQAENGLTLSRMALAQVCGLPLMDVFVLDDSELEETTLPASDVDAEAAVAGRTELQLMEEAEKIAKRTAKLASASLQPNIVASANYVYTNPNAENGIRSDFKGTGFFSAGVVVNVPIAHADAILRYKAAKHAANMATLKTEETRELLTLQTTQASQKLMEAQQKIALARLTKNNAAEVLRMADESFEAGMITASELMQAQTAWLAAASDLVDAEVEAKTTETQLRKYLRKL